MKNIEYKYDDLEEALWHESSSISKKDLFKLLSNIALEKAIKTGYVLPYFKKECKKELKRRSTLLGRILYGCAVISNH